MSTKNFVPRANNEGGIGTEAKQWGSVWSKNIYVDGTNVKNTLTTLEQNLGTLNTAAATKATTFNSVALMKEAPLEPGMVAMTTGYHNPNDGGAAVYNIRAAVSGETYDNGSIIFLDNGNVAELICDGTVNVKQFGAIGNGTDDDTTVFQNTYSYAQAKGFVPFVGVATYKITSNITGTFNSFGEVTITGGGTVDIINLQEVVSDVSDIRDEVVDETASAKTYAENAQASATSAAGSASSASTTARALTDIYNEAISSGQIVAPAVDATLTISGAAADAKATGDLYASYGHINGISGIVFENGFLNASTGAEEANSQYIRSKPFQIKDGRKKIINLLHINDPIATYTYITCLLYIYNADGTYVTRVSVFGDEINYYDFDPSKIYRLTIRYRNGGSSWVNISVETHSFLASYLFFLDAYQEEFDKLAYANTLFCGFEFTFTQGGINTNGNNTSSSTRVRTNYCQSNADVDVWFKNEQSPAEYPDDYLEFQIAVYDENKDFVRFYSRSGSKDVLNARTLIKNYYYRIAVIRTVDGEEVAIDPTDTALLSKISVIKQDATVTNETNYYYHNNITVAVGHQGYHKNYKPNTKEAIIEAAKKGFDITQFNVRFSQDGEFILHHDNTIYVLTDTHKIVSSNTFGAVAYKLDEHDYDDISQYTYESSYDQEQHIPTLDEVLLACKTYGIRPYILMGGMSLEKRQELVALVRKYCLEEATIFAGDGSIPGYGPAGVINGLLPKATVEVIGMPFLDPQADFVASDGKYHYIYEHVQNGYVAGVNVQLNVSEATVEENIAYLASLRAIGLKTTVCIINDVETYKTYAPYSDRMMSNTLLPTDVYV